MDGRDMLNTILCEELLAEILCRIRNPVDHESISLVCKRWKKVQRNAKWRLGLRLPTDATCMALFYASLPALLAQHSYITCLCLKSDTPCLIDILVTQVVRTVAINCKCLRQLSFMAGSITSVGLEELANGCPQLHSLELLQPVSANCWPLLSKFKSLQELFISGHTDEAICIEHGHKPSANENLDDANVHSSRGSLRLMKLCLFNMRSCASCDLRWLWRNCGQLQKLELSNCEGVGDTAAMSAFVHCMPLLRELKLHRSRSIAGEVMALASKYSSELRALTVHDGADTGGLRLVLQRCKALELLDLRLPLDLSKEDLMEIGRHGQWLRSLRLHSCWLATGADMRSLASNITCNLEELVLVRCRAIVQEPGTLLAIAQGLPNLKHIDLAENEHLADKELAAMLAACKGVRHLNLWKCSRLTDKVIDFISQKCSVLESIDLRCCEGISTKAVTSLLMSCMCLKSICIEPNKLSKTAKHFTSMKGIVLNTMSSPPRERAEAKLRLTY